MSTARFGRPDFQAPVLPTPPTIYTVPSPVTATVPTLASVTNALPAITKNPLGTVNPSLAQNKVQAQASAQNTLRSKLGSIKPPASLPTSITANPSTVTDYDNSLTNLLAQGTSKVDEFGRPKS